MRLKISHRQVGYCLIAVGVLASAWAFFLLLSSPSPPPVTRTPGTNQKAPSAVKPQPQAIASYQVAPDLPKYITIPAINIAKTRVIQLGLTKDDQIAVPDNIYDAGWYRQSAKPGQPGATFIYGHVSNWQANGIFYNLKKLKAGDAITITRGDDQTYTYKVVSVKVYPHDNVDMTQVLAPIDAAKPGLNLMTCTGQVIKGTSEFNQRLVVFTSLV